MIPPTQTYIYVYIHIKAEPTDTENRMRVTRGWGVEKWGDIGQGYKLLVIR